MTIHAIFEGLVFDENGNAAETRIIGKETFYVVDDDGFLRHIPSIEVDRQIYDILKKQFEDNKDLIIEQTAKLLGQDDPFSQAVLANQFGNLDQQFEMLQKVGIPENDRMYMGMTGFRAVIDLHGNLLELQQPSRESGEDE
ncbi:MAG: hypothetical protein HPY85_03485 [Anaerolineae bacterium]|nr:hypothetical protein [Anaerolineae bacterium]